MPRCSDRFLVSPLRGRWLLCSRMRTGSILARLSCSVESSRQLRPLGFSSWCSFRPEFFPQWLDESHVTMLRLNRLPREQSEIIISDVAGHKELPHELHEQIIRKADGVPLFAEELTKTVLESGLLHDTGERYVTVGPLRPLAIPTTLLGSLTARLDQAWSDQRDRADWRCYRSRILLPPARRCRPGVWPLARHRACAPCCLRVDLRPRRTTGFNLYLQACAGSGCGLRHYDPEQAPTPSQSHCRCPHGGVPRDRRNAARVDGSSPGASGAHRESHRVFAKGWAPRD